MLGKRREAPEGITEELEEILYVLNLLDCSMAAPVIHVHPPTHTHTMPLVLDRDLAELPAPESTTWESLHAAVEAGKNSRLMKSAA